MPRFHSVISFRLLRREFIWCSNSGEYVEFVYPREENADLLRFAENTGEQRHPKMKAIRNSGMEIASNLAITC